MSTRVVRTDNFLTAKGIVVQTCCSNVAFVSGGLVFSLYLCFLWDFKNTCFRLRYDSLLLQIGIMLGYAQLMHSSVFE